MLKPHVIQFGSLVAEFYKIVVDVGPITDESLVNSIFQEIVVDLLEGHISLNMQTIAGCYDLYTDWSRHAGGFVLCKDSRLVFMGSTTLEGWPSQYSRFLGEAHVIGWSLKHIAWVIRRSIVTIHTDSAGSTQKLTNVDSSVDVTDLRLLRIFSYNIGNFGVETNLFFQDISGMDNVIENLLSRWKLQKNEVTTIKKNELLAEKKNFGHTT